MRLPLKHIVILVVCSLIRIFVYQAYWSTGPYRLMKMEMENSIRDVMRMSDSNEVVLRVNNLQEDNVEHGSLMVSVGYDADGSPLVTEQTVSYTDNSRQDTIHPRTETTTDTVKAVGNTSEDPAPVANSENELDVPLKKQDSLKELSMSIQQGIHSGVDTHIGVNPQRCDDLLTHVMKEHNLFIPHHALLVYAGISADSSIVYTDTLDTAGDSSYIPSPKAIRYGYEFSMHYSQRYQLAFEPINPLVLKQMTGILVTSFVILLILGFSFWFLVQTLLKQKTLGEMRSGFTNDIAYELKTPATAAYVANDALLNSNQTEEKSRCDWYLRISQEQLQRLSGLVGQILSMGMERRKTFRLHPEEINLKELITLLMEQHQLKANKPIRIELGTQPGTLVIVADRTHFSNIISNLIGNVVKYSKEETELSISCQQTGGTVTVSVTDRGIGISLDKRKHIFDRFYRVPTGSLHNTKGYGLGLSYVKSMVKKHGGTITVKSEPDKGNTFTITL